MFFFPLNLYFVQKHPECTWLLRVWEGENPALVEHLVVGMSVRLLEPAQLSRLLASVNVQRSEIEGDVSETALYTWTGCLWAGSPHEPLHHLLLLISLDGAVNSGHCGWASGSTSRFRPVVFVHAPELQAETTTLDKPSVPYPRMAYADVSSSLALDLELYCSVDLNLAADSFKSSYIITLKSFRFEAGRVRVQGQMN